MALGKTSGKMRMDFMEALNDAVGESNEEIKEIKEPVKEKIKKPEEKVKEKTVTKTESKKSIATEKTSVKTKPEKKEAPSDLDEILSRMAPKGTGFQKSVYFDADVYNFITEKSKKTGAKFSTIVNLILRQAMEQK